jgi:glycosyltransferase involved in cell wall biosynthesis
VETLYRGADVLVLPTQREGGTPNVVLEAMASRLAVIITAFYGQSMAIGRPGVEFEQVERNPEALANVLQQVLGDSHRRQALASRGRVWVEEHLDVERSLDQYAALYRRLACRR